MDETGSHKIAASTPSVCAIIVNWQRADLTIAAAAAALRQTLTPHVIVVDNGSDADVVQKLRNNLSTSVTLVERAVNGGFGAGCNAGITKARARKADYVWLLNNDADADPRCLEELYKCAKSTPATGAVCALVQDPKDETAPHAGVVLNPVTLQCENTTRADDLNAASYAWTTAACLLLPVSALDRVGDFDEAYFMYWEDADLAMRLKRAGFKLLVAPSALAYHHAGSSGDRIPLLRFRWHLESQQRWLNSHHSHPSYGATVMFARHLVKSLISLNFPRFRMTLSHLLTDASRNSGIERNGPLFRQNK